MVWCRRIDHNVTPFGAAATPTPWARALDKALASIPGTGISGYSCKPAGGFSHRLLTLSTWVNYRDTFGFIAFVGVLVFCPCVFSLLSMCYVVQLVSSGDVQHVVSHSLMVPLAQAPDHRGWLCFVSHVCSRSSLGLHRVRGRYLLFHLGYQSFDAMIGTCDTHVSCITM